jgi:hypothetical protein
VALGNETGFLVGTGSGSGHNGKDERGVDHGDCCVSM